MPFFRVHTAFSGPPVIPHCKDIRFRVIAGYPDYGSSYHFYGIVRRRPQKGCFLRLYLAAVPSHAVRFCHPFPVRLVRLLLFLPSVPASAVCFCFCFCCSVPFPCLFLSPPSAFASAVRFRFRHPVPSPPSFPACAVRFSSPLPGDEKACGHNRAAGFPEQALLPFGERYSASSTNTALS